MYRADQTHWPRREHRVSDVLVAENVPETGNGGEVVRKGPRADELFAGILL